MIDDERAEGASDDAALFDEIVNAASEDHVDQTQEPEAQDEPPVPEKPRDESGRFAKAEEKSPEPTKAEEDAGNGLPKDKAEANVPSFRVKEEADARRAAEERASRAEREAAETRQMLMQLMQKANQQQQPQNAVEPPDVFVDPDAWYRHKAESEFGPVLQQMQAARLADARAVAEVIHGADKIAAAEKAFDELAARNQVDPSDYQKIMQAPNRFRAAVEWFDRQSLLKEVGGDPAAFKTRLREELKSDPEFVREVIESFKNSGGGNPANPPQNVTRLPPSLNRATAAARTNAQAESEPSDAELWGMATRRR